MPRAARRSDAAASSAPHRPPVDLNATVSWLLRDMAAAQSSRQKLFGYKRAASAVFWLEEPLSSLWTAGGLSRKVPGLGPASLRIVGEFLSTGASPTVERAIAAGDPKMQADIARRRDLRGHFLSRAAVLEILSSPANGAVSPEDYGGDLQMHSEWSDGSATVGEIADACADRGYGSRP